MRYKVGATKRNSIHGFTAIELLIVIVMVTILAAMAIISYNSVTKSAQQSRLLSDVSNAATIMSTDHLANGVYATSISSARGGRGIAASPGVSYLFHSDGVSYCITAQSSNQDIASYYVSNSAPKPTLGECPEDIVH